jgi:hypothetical protein
MFRVHVKYLCVHVKKHRVHVKYLYVHVKKFHVHVNHLCVHIKKVYVLYYKTEYCRLPIFYKIEFEGKYITFKVMMQESYFYCRSKSHNVFSPLFTLAF